MLTKRPLAPFIALYLLYIAALDKVPVSTHLYYIHTYIYVHAHKAATRALHCTIPRLHCCPRQGTCFNAFVLYTYICICTCSQSNHSRPYCIKHIIQFALDKVIILMHISWIHTYICTYSQSGHSRPSMHCDSYTLPPSTGGCPRQGDYFNAHILDTYIDKYMLAKRLLALFLAPYLVYVAAHDTVIISKHMYWIHAFTRIYSQRGLSRPSMHCTSYTLPPSTKG